MDDKTSKKMSKKERKKLSQELISNGIAKDKKQAKALMKNLTEYFEEMTPEEREAHDKEMNLETIIASLHDCLTERQKDLIAHCVEFSFSMEIDEKGNGSILVTDVGVCDFPNQKAPHPHFVASAFEELLRMYFWVLTDVIANVRYEKHPPDEDIACQNALEVRNEIDPEIEVEPHKGAAW